MEKVAAEVVISGKVQGVFYRVETQREAIRLGVTGWVRNQVDKTVKVSMEGDKADVEALIAWCWDGSPSAQVDGVNVDWVTYTGKFSSFEIAY